MNRLPVPGTVGAALLEAERRLTASGALRPRRHAELLLESVLHVDRTGLYLGAGNLLDAMEEQKFDELLCKREKGVPVQYLTGWAPFYGKRFYVGEGVFIPRFETELLMERLFFRLRDDFFRFDIIEVLDLCCGCGAIGLTAATELPQVNTTLIDLSDAALEYASRNALALLVNNRVNILKLDAQQEFPVEWRNRFHVVLANPPYISVNEIDSLPPDVRDGEPRLALTDDADGLSFYRRWTETLPAILAPGAAFFTEVADGQAWEVERILSTFLSNRSSSRDLNGVERVIEGTFRSSLG